MVLPWRRLVVGLLIVLVALIVWRGARLAWLTWKSLDAVRTLESAATAPAPVSTPASGASALSASGDAAALDITAEDLAVRLPALAAGLPLLDARLGALEAEIAPLVPVLHWLGSFGGFGMTLADLPDQLAAVRRLVSAAAAMGPHLDWLLGVDAPRHYLLLVQNNHELRATGGFISAFGYLVLDSGRIAGIDFADSYDLFSMQSEYPPAPEPMEQYMGIQLLVPRDANWSPDLPTAAADIVRLYRQDSGRSVDGIITLDLNTVRHLVAALEPLSVPGVGNPITAANLQAELIRLWEQPPAGQDAPPAGAQPASESASGDWWSRRKDFVPLVAGAILQRMEAGRFDAPALVTAIAAALDDRSLQVWLDQPQLQQVLAAFGWDGGLHPQPGADYLAVVDANLGYNKVDAAIGRQLDYQVSWPEGPAAGARAVLTLTYTHGAAGTDPGCDPTPRYGAGYADLIARCYFDYVRVYVPAGSRLIDVDGIAPETVTSMPGEQGTQQFAGYFVTAPGSVKTITFTYRLPPALSPQDYGLLIQRQSGTNPLRLHVNVAGAEYSGVISPGSWRWPGR